MSTGDAPSHAPQVPSDPVGVLFLCLGNICRSPLAEGAFLAALGPGGLRSDGALALAALKDSGRLLVDSAGTGAWHAGEAPDSRSIRVARDNGVDISGQRARQLVHLDYARFDWIVAMDEDNLRVAERSRPPGDRHRRARCVAFVDFVPDGAHPGRVPDPYYGDLGGFREVWSLLMRGMPGLIEAIAESAEGRPNR